MPEAESEHQIISFKMFALRSSHTCRCLWPAGRMGSRYPIGTPVQGQPKNIRLLLSTFQQNLAQLGLVDTYHNPKVKGQSENTNMVMYHLPRADELQHWSTQRCHLTCDFRKTLKRQDAWCLLVSNANLAKPNLSVCCLLPIFSISEYLTGSDRSPKCVWKLHNFSVPSHQKMAIFSH